MKLWENDERAYEVKDLDDAKRLIAGLGEAMACVDCDPQRYRLYGNNGELVYEQPAQRIP